MLRIKNHHLINQCLNYLLIQLFSSRKLVQCLQSSLHIVILYHLSFMKLCFQFCYICIQPLCLPCQISTPTLIYILIQRPCHELINISKPLRITFFSVLLQLSQLLHQLGIILIRFLPLLLHFFLCLFRRSQQSLDGFPDSLIEYILSNIFLAAPAFTNLSLRVRTTKISIRSSVDNSILKRHRPATGATFDFLP